MEFRILGPLEAWASGHLIDLGPPRQRVLLSLLLLHVNRVIPIDALIEAHWPKTTPRSATAMIHVRVCELRRTLRAAQPNRADLILTRRPGYVVVLTEADEIDAVRFEALAAAGQRTAAAHHPAEARTLFNEALELWRGPVLADVAHLPFAQAERGRLDELHLATIENRIDADLACGRHTAAIGELEALIIHHPLRETFWRRLMLAKYRAGRQAEALSTYQDARRTLIDALGTEPGRELRTLHDAMLHRDPELAPDNVQATMSGESRSNLPGQISSFIGRDAELGKTAALLRRGRLVTITGVGGVGKTRLALEFATSRQAEYPDGCRLVELSAISDPNLVVPAVATAVGIREHPERTLSDLLVSVLRSARALLVLDNCEHLLDAVASLVQRVLATCDRIHILTTSRERLGIIGESVLLLAGLETSTPTDEPVGAAGNPAIRLFVERAGAVCPSYQLTGGTAQAVQQICQVLDGLPLAIELAAARMSGLDPQQIADRLDDRFTLLNRGSRTALPRHQTLSAVLDWSYHLLTEDQRRLFDRSTVFVGGFDLEAAQAVCARDAGVDIADPLSRLVDQSLVTVSHTHVPAPRYGLLETVRAYGQRHLCDAATSAAHAVYFTTLAETAAVAFRGPDEADWLRRLDIEHGNLRAALGWCVDVGAADLAARLAGALHHFWDLHGHYHEGRQWLRRVLALDGPVEPTSRGRALYGAGELAMIQGDFTESTRCFGQARDLFHSAGDSVGVADSLRYLGYMAICDSEWERADALLAEALDNARVSGSAYAEGWALLFLGALALARRDFDDAARKGAESESVLRSVGQREAIGWSYLIQGGAEWGLGHPKRAATAIGKSIDVFDTISGIWGLAIGLMLSAVLSATQQHYTTATRLLGASNALRDTVGAGSMPFLEQWSAQAVTDATTALGSETFEREWHTGEAAPLNASVAGARKILRAIALDTSRLGRGEPRV